MIHTDNRLAAIRTCVVLAENTRGESLTQALSRTPGFSILAVATRPEDALAELSRYSYDVLVTNIHLNATLHSGLQLLSRAVAVHEGLRGIVLGETDDRPEVVASFRSGARGFVVQRDCSAATLSNAIRCVHEGHVWASSRHFCFVLDEFSACPAPTPPMPQIRGALSNREWEVAQLITRGKSNKEIAAALQVSQHTVKNHLVKIFIKLGVTSRSEAVFRIYQHSLTRVSMPPAEYPAKFNEAINW